MDERTNALPVGTELEGYRVVALLGAGGFGITYKAVDLLLDRHVAIKEYLPSVLANRGADRKTVKPFGRQEAEQFVWGLERFRTEAKTLVAFQHPNIVPVHRYFESNGTGYLVMAFQDGKSLADVIDAVGTLSEDELLTILRPLAIGLADVHAKGFLHRDIKPANIIIRRDGTPVLIDFGAARQAVTRQSRGLTAIVTEGYAPYEQYETDSHQGPWTDIYALGAVLYHCVTGRRPPEAPKRIAAQLRKQPDPMVPAGVAAGGNYSESLLGAIDQALTVEEAKRPQSVKEFIAAVEGRAPAPGAATGIPAGEAFMVDVPSQPLERLTRAAAAPPVGAAPAAPAGDPSAEIAGNFMVEAPSSPLGRRSAAPAPPKEPLIARVRKPDQPAPAPASDTLMVGGATLIVGSEQQAAAPEAPSVVQPTEPPARRGLRSRAAAPEHQQAPARKRSKVPLIAGVVVALLAGGGAAGYLAQRGGAPGPAANAPPPQTDTASAPPAAPSGPKTSEEGAARSKAAAPEQIWQHLEGKTGQDVVRRIFVLPDDQILIVGGRIDAEGGNSDVWFWRFDAKEGKPVGERKTITNARFDSANAIVLRADGGLALAAARKNLGSNSLVGWVARTSADGELQWQHTFQEYALTLPYALTVLANGDMIVVGSATEQGQNGTKGWAARIAADGRVVWNKLFGKGVDESLQSVAMLPDGGIIAVGWLNVERPAGEDRNLWILALDGEGNVRWEKKDLGDEADEKGKSVLVATGGDIVVLAEASRVPPQPAAAAPKPARPGAPPAEAEPVNKPWLLRLAPDGTVRWDKRYSGGKDDASDSLDALVPAGDGGFFMSGSTESKGAGRKDAWLVRIDAEGAVLWDQRYGDQFDDEFTALAALPDGGVLTGGSTALKTETPAAAPPRPARPGAKPEPPSAEAKLWLLRHGYK